MLEYLIIQLDDTSTSYCHYENRKTKPHLISLDDLRTGILFAMKENLMIQFVYPDYELPQEYKDVINTIDHNNIVSSLCQDKRLKEKADVIVFNNWADINKQQLHNEMTCVLRITKADLFGHYQSLMSTLHSVKRLNIVITDIETFKEEDFKDYNDILHALSKEVEKLYLDGISPQLNILTDRIMLTEMNNCDAGWKNVTLAPNGKFYVCPAFYQQRETDGTEISVVELCQKGYAIGNLQHGLSVSNPQLYKLDHAPICRNCDAYQCKRCIWLNRKTTCETNTPSHEQCVVAHLERNNSRVLLSNIRAHGSFLPEKGTIEEIDYLDPFDKIGNW